MQMPEGIRIPIVPMTNRMLAKRALASYGLQGQTDQALEKLHELACELHHLRRGRETPGLAEAIADVLICLAQLVCHVGADVAAEAVGRKEARLKEELDAYFGKEGQ